MSFPQYKVVYGFYFPWDIKTMMFAVGSGGITASILSVQPLWGMLVVACVVDLLIGLAASRRERTLSFRVAEDRFLTNMVIAAVSKFFFMLSDNAEHFKSVHGALVQPLTDIYPFGDWMAITCMILVVRSMVGHLSIFNIKIPWLTQWLEQTSAQDAPPDDSNQASGGSIIS